MDQTKSRETPGALPQSSSSPIAPQPPVQVTPSDTTITLPTPDFAYAQLVGVQCHNPPQFIFYPISWDGSEDPSTLDKRTTQPNLAPSDIFTDYVDDDQLSSPSAVFCSTDAFWSIDRWRRDVVKCGGSTADLLDPIQDADAPLPLLSLPNDHHKPDPFGRTQPAKPPPRGTDSNGSEEDSVRLWIHP